MEVTQEEQGIHSAPSKFVFWPSVSPREYLLSGLTVIHLLIHCLFFNKRFLSTNNRCWGYLSISSGAGVIEANKTSLNLMDFHILRSLP